ncbi:MAG: branched-chain amino acid ABC transporter permease [Anaerolineales bacterium]|nr:branched-chain amino acid ABC transporter permease [Anaerolineales bacterium]
MNLTPQLLLNFLIAGIMLGALYALMAMGITFIYSIMKMINWSMGEFYMLGSYVQWALVSFLLGAQYWYLGVVGTIIVMFFVGLIVQRLLIRPMFSTGMERKDEYGTVVTIALALFLRNLMTYLSGPDTRSPGKYMGRINLAGLPVSGDRFAAFIGAIVIITLFYVLLRYTWIGLAFRASSQNRVGVQTAGLDILNLDQMAFGIGIVLAAVAGALLAPVFLVYPENGAVTTMKGFEIIIIGGMGSLPGAALGGILLGLTESLGSVFIGSSLRNVYGFVLLLIILIIKPTGLFGERERLS